MWPKHPLTYWRTATPPATVQRHWTRIKYSHADSHIVASETKRFFHHELWKPRTDTWIWNFIRFVLNRAMWKMWMAGAYVIKPAQSLLGAVPCLIFLCGWEAYQFSVFIPFSIPFRSLSFPFRSLVGSLSNYFVILPIHSLFGPCRFLFGTWQFLFIPFSVLVVHFHIPFQSLFSPCSVFLWSFAFPFRLQWIVNSGNFVFFVELTCG